MESKTYWGGSIVQFWFNPAFMRVDDDAILITAGIFRHVIPYQALEIVERFECKRFFRTHIGILFGHTLTSIPSKITFWPDLWLWQHRVDDIIHEISERRTLADMAAWNASGKQRPSP